MAYKLSDNTIEYCELYVTIKQCNDRYALLLFLHLWPCLF